MNLHLVEMQEDGFVEGAIDSDLQLSSEIDCDVLSSNSDGVSEDDDSYRLSIQDMGGLFIIFYSVMFVTIAMALFGKWNGKRRLNRTREENGNASADNCTDEEAVPKTESLNDLRPSDEQEKSANEAAQIAEGPAMQQSNDILTMMDNIQRELEELRRLVRSSNGA